MHISPPPRPTDYNNPAFGFFALHLRGGEATLAPVLHRVATACVSSSTVHLLLQSEEERGGIWIGIVVRKKAVPHVFIPLHPIKSQLGLLLLDLSPPFLVPFLSRECRRSCRRRPPAPKDDATRSEADFTRGGGKRDAWDGEILQCNDQMDPGSRNGLLKASAERQLHLNM